MALRYEKRSPFEYCQLAAMVLAGILVLGTDSTPPSVEENLGSWFDLVWVLFLMFGSAIALTGLYWKDRVTGLLVESIGQVLASGAALLYAAVLGVANFAAPLNMCMFGGFGVAGLIRFVHIRLWARKRRKGE